MWVLHKVLTSFSVAKNVQHLSSSRCPEHLDVPVVANEDAI